MTKRIKDTSFNSLCTHENLVSERGFLSCAFCGEVLYRKDEIIDTTEKEKDTSASLSSPNMNTFFRDEVKKVIPSMPEHRKVSLETIQNNNKNHQRFFKILFVALSFFSYLYFSRYN